MEVNNTGSKKKQQKLLLPAGDSGEARLLQQTPLALPAGLAGSRTTTHQLQALNVSVNATDPDGTWETSPGTAPVAGLASSEYLMDIITMTSAT